MGKIAPHLNNEVRLVLGGMKPMASIEKEKDPYGHSLAISVAGTGALAIKHYKGEVVIAKPNTVHIGWYETLLEFGVRDFGIKQYHREMGKLFGYTEDDIEAFIKAEIDCDCIKCTGIINK